MKNQRTLRAKKYASCRIIKIKEKIFVKLYEKTRLRISTV